MSGETAAMEAAASAAPAPAEEAPASEASHAFESVDAAVTELGKVREEAARYRTSYAPFRDTFDGLDESTVDFVLEAVRDLKSDSPEGVTKWLDLGAKMAKEEEFDAWVSGRVPPPPSAPDPTPAPAESPVDVEALVAKALADDRAAREAEAAEAATRTRAEALVTQAETLGYKPNTGPYSALFDVAMRDGISLEEADVVLRAEFAGEQAAPRVPGTVAVQSAGGVQTPEAAEKLSAAERLSARLDKVEQGIPG